MDTKTQVIKYLETEPKFRERSAKLRGIADLLIKNYNLDIDRRKLADILRDAESMNRYHRQILQDYPDLRGNDYETGEIVSQDYQQKIGYEVGHREDLKLKTLF